MASLTETVVAETVRLVRVVYLDRATAKLWNSRRDNGDTAVFCGFYWIKGGNEGGPFKTRSSALRDAYYRFVLRRDPPTAGHTVIKAKPKSGSNITSRVAPKRRTRSRPHLGLNAA